MRLTAVSCLCLVLTGCSSYAPSGGSTAAQAPPPRANGLAPGSAATFYSVASNITGGAPCGTSSISQVLGFPTEESGVATPALTITSPNTVDRYGLVATDAAGNIYVFSSNTAQACGEVPGSAKILVFAPATSGTTTANPIRTITGPVAQLDGAGLMAVDGPGNIYLWESQGFGSTAPDTLVQFAAGA